MEILLCKNCNKTSKNKHFCDMDCYTNYKRRNQIELICVYCSKKFSVSKKRASEVRHCSRFCYISSANKSQQRVCKDCKKPKHINNFNLHSPVKDLRRRYCISCERKRLIVNSRTPKARWTQARNRSARSGDLWDISFETFQNLISQNCHYCSGKLNPTGCGLDRKNNLLEYTEDNIVPCCCVCNKVKMDHFTYEEMMLLSPILRKIKEDHAN